MPQTGHCAGLIMTPLKTTLLGLFFLVLSGNAASVVAAEDPTDMVEPPYASPDSPEWGKPAKEPSVLPWDDSYVSREGLVLVDVGPGRKGCTVSIREPYDPIIVDRDARIETDRYMGYDLHEQMIGLPQRRFRVDFGTLITRGC